MRIEICADCEELGSQVYCKKHNSKPGILCDYNECIKYSGYGKLLEKVSDEQLNKLTLEISKLLFESGFDVKYNEDNNALRGYLFQFLTEWLEHDIDKLATTRYVDWEKLRTKFNI